MGGKMQDLTTNTSNKCWRPTVKKYAIWFTLILSISSLNSTLAKTQEEIKPSMWMPKAAKTGMIENLEQLYSNVVLAEKNDPMLLRLRAITTVNKFDEYLWTTGVQFIISNAPVFKTPGYPKHEEKAMEAMGRYQMCVALFTIMLPPYNQPSTSDTHFAIASGLVMSLISVFYIQTSRDQPISTFEPYATSDAMGVLIQRMQDEPEVKLAFTDDCLQSMRAFVAAIK